MIGKHSAIERDVNCGFTTYGRSSREAIVVLMNQKRLTGLRAYRKLTVQKLAERSQMPAHLIEAFESGEDWPDSEQCIALADALSVDVSRLLDAGDLTFRDFVRRGGGELSSQQVSAIGVAMVDRIRDHLDVREILDLPSISWTAPGGAPVAVRTLSEAEAAADLVRAAWGLGDEPVEDLVGLLEEHGVLVVEHDFGCEAFVATVEHDGTESLYAIGAKGGRWSLRRRFSLAHELGHICMDCHKGVDPEQAADRFAAAFLIPPSIIRAAVREGSVREVLDLRARYGASAQAIALRCVELHSLGHAWKADVIAKVKALDAASGAARWDNTADLFERRCREAHDRGLIGRSRLRELLEGLPSGAGADAA